MTGHEGHLDDSGLLKAEANKALGQHFLFDPDILKRAAFAAGKVEGRVVVEVGPGPGGLTRALLRNGARKVFAVETDERFANALLEWPEAKDGSLEVIGQDGLTVDYEALVRPALEEDETAMIIANLPYNVGTPLLTGWLKAEAWRGEMALMFQKEVAQRICAQPGEKHYGRLAVLAHAVTRPRLSFSLPPGAFKPPPKVASAVVALHPLKPENRYQRLDVLEQVTAAAFGQRRKMLRASLRGLAGGSDAAIALLEASGIDPALRAEVLTQEDFRRLTDQWIALRDQRPR